MAEINKTRETIQIGIDHIQESGALSAQEASVVSQGKGNFYAALESLSTTIELFEGTQANFGAAANLHSKAMEEIRAGCDQFRAVDLDEAPPEVIGMVFDLTVSNENMEPLTRVWRNFATEIGVLVGQLSEVYRSNTEGTTEVGLNNSIKAVKDYANRVVPGNVSVAEAWRDSI